MFDREAIYKRFASCFTASRSVELATILAVRPQRVYEWKSGKKPIQWWRLKKVVDEEGLTWDWLIDGKEPKMRQNSKEERCGPLNRHSINQRFLSLFPDMSQDKIGKELGINGTTVFKWRHDIEQVPWERLKYAVDIKGATWEWLIEGR